ncbi:hypothetical protein GCM10023160_33690 [Brachybacterium paraconglomeratum]
MPGSSAMLGTSVKLQAEASRLMAAQATAPWRKWRRITGRSLSRAAHMQERGVAGVLDVPGAA